MLQIVYCVSFSYLEHVPIVALPNYTNLPCKKALLQLITLKGSDNCQAKMILFYSVEAKTFDS